MTVTLPDAGKRFRSMQVINEDHYVVGNVIYEAGTYTYDRKKVRSQFHHVVDVAPTIYEILGIKPPKVVNGQEQMKIDGTSLAYTFTPRHLQGRLNGLRVWSLHPLEHTRVGVTHRALGLVHR